MCKPGSNQVVSERWVLTAQARRAFQQRYHIYARSRRPSSCLLSLRHSYWTPPVESSLAWEPPEEFHVSSAASTTQPQSHPESLTGAQLSSPLPNSARASKLRSGPARAFPVGFPLPISVAWSSPTPPEQSGEYHASAAASST
ncbi:hypothetical protein NDU88_007405 [Pleurodeles waltl]|uniref:Uncharacterized protein n=1 Tax=Pleurodeles waltl TaxID=8319 RepID=A0AAV7U117_PLEWA|nr:hypothetical protein NDU88_007405 [Pleurodeles waltl]